MKQFRHTESCIITQSSKPFLSLAKRTRGAHLWPGVSALYQQQLPAGKGVDSSLIRGSLQKQADDGVSP